MTASSPSLATTAGNKKNKKLTLIGELFLLGKTIEALAKALDRIGRGLFFISS
ncbi:hypothetical protein FTV88_0008 [Heliorestis convoluta]|uniref:Uncharacterized protein n=1 Tax=Heliorestis convoluta TaxID=356322 RepID=A0A5Q2MVI8_9FIRM|nr:hypothetical protein FTV88_0008 [Heliorestis convoluta]